MDARENTENAMYCPLTKCLCMNERCAWYRIEYAECAMHCLHDIGDCLAKIADDGITIKSVDGTVSIGGVIETV